MYVIDVQRKLLHVTLHSDFVQSEPLVVHLYVAMYELYILYAKDLLLVHLILITYPMYVGAVTMVESVSRA